MDETEETLQTGYQVEFKQEQLNNDREVDVTFPQEIVTTNLIGDTVSYKITNATLKPRMYDVHKIQVRDSLGTNFTDPSTMKKFVIEVRESLSYRSKPVLFNMGTRKYVDDMTYEQLNQICDEAVFYNPYFYYNNDTGFYELEIYVAARSECNGIERGFNDSVVCVILPQFRENPSDDEDRVITSYSVRYRCILPPFMVQGIPYKNIPLAEDPVFPDGASRVDIGVGTIECYYNNKHGYQDDYLFTNCGAESGSGPLYQINTSAFMPAYLGSDYSFGTPSAYLLNEDTLAKLPLTTNSVDNSDDERALYVMTFGDNNDEYSAYYFMNEWITDISAADDRYTHKNKVVIECGLNLNEPEEETVEVIAWKDGNGLTPISDAASADIFKWEY